MNNFEQRMERITERSRQILAHRRKIRKMVFTACIPLLPCSIGVLMLLPKPDKHTGIQEPQETTSTIVPIGRTVMFQSDTWEKAVKDQVSVQRLAQTIEELYRSEGTVSMIPGDNGATAEDSDTEYTTDSSATASILTITFFEVDGSQKRYTLIGNYLTDEAAKRTVTLTDNQVAEIRREIP